MKVKCYKCENEFDVSNKKYKLYVKERLNFYCSKTCRGQAFSLLRKKRSNLKCDNCGKDIERVESQKGKHNFCCQSCSASFNNKGVRRHGVSPVVIKCSGCGASTVNKKYCSNKCQTFVEWELKKEKIKTENRVYFGECERNNRFIAKKYLIDVEGHKCAVCGFSEWLSEPIPLVIDHIDGNSRNNNLDNFRLVCGNCNMKLPTFAGRNKGKGTRARREVYNGKEYVYHRGVV